MILRTDKSRGGSVSKINMFLAGFCFSAFLLCLFAGSYFIAVINLTLAVANIVVAYNVEDY